MWLSRSKPLMIYFTPHMETQKHISTITSGVYQTVFFIINSMTEHHMRMVLIYASGDKIELTINDGHKNARLITNVQ